MKVEIRLFASLRKFQPDNASIDGFMMELANRSKVMDVLNQLNIPPELARLIFINGRKGSPNDVLKDNDRIGLFPPVAGG